MLDRGVDPLQFFFRGGVTHESFVAQAGGLNKSQLLELIPRLFAKYSQQNDAMEWRT